MKKVILFSLVVASSVFARSVTIDVSKHVPIYETREVTNTVEDCGSGFDDNNILGTVVGGVAGGVIGNQFGGGSGKKLATVAGAIGGGIAGNQVQKNVKNKNCTYKNVTSTKEVLTGYRNIGYYKGKEYSKVTLEKQPKIVIEVR